MKRVKSFGVAVIVLVFVSLAGVSIVSSATDDHSDVAVEAAAGANLVVTAVSGPAVDTENRTLAVTYTVKNKGDAASGPYQVALYLSTDKTVDAAADRLLDKVMFTSGLAPGQSRQRTTKVLLPNAGLSGSYYYGAVVGGSRKASSGQVSLARYSLADDNDTVRDHKTGLVWQRADDGIARNWANAGAYCEDLVLGGRPDWRLPRIDELETIVDYSKLSPAIDPVFSCRSNNYWSGSTSAGTPDDAWYVYFSNGYASWNNKTYATNYVRCARGGPW